MFRQSPHYYEIRQQVFKDINNDLAQELASLKLSDTKQDSVVKKSVTKQEFISYFYKKNKNDNQQMEAEICLKCKHCNGTSENANTICVECSRLMCQRCFSLCHYCGQICCIICSVRIYLSYGDFISCLHCSQKQ